MSRRLELDELKTMINSFRCSDLVSLLGSVGRNKSGRKSELQLRALEILKNPTPDINQDVFRRKIRELYKAAQDEAKQTHNLEMQQQQMIPHNMQSGRIQHVLAAQHANPMQQARPLNNMNPYGAVPSQPYHHQPQRGNMTGNAVYQANMGIGNSYAGGMYNQTNTQAIQNPSANSICNYGNTALIVNHNYLTTASNFIFRKLPFYKIKHEILKPTLLVPNSHSTLPTNLRTTATQEFLFSFVLSCEMASDMAMNRDISNGKNEYNVQAQLRISAFDNATNNVTEYDDFLPLGLVVRLNQRQCTLPLCSPNSRSGTESRRIPRPINITPHMRMSPMNVNNLVVNWASEAGKTFVLTVNLVEKLTSEYLLNKLREKPTISVDVTKLTIREQYKRVIDDDDDTDEANADDDDIATTIVRVSLVCPLAKFRMMYPAKGKNCSHLQCFDGSAYISLNEKKPMWMCPVCNRTLYFDDLLIDQYFLDVLQNEQLSPDCQEVQLLVDGTWKSYDEEATNDEEKSKNSNPASSPMTPLPTSSKPETNNGDSVEMIVNTEDTDRKESAVTDMLVDASAAIGGPVVDLTEEEEEMPETATEVPLNTVNDTEQSERVSAVSPPAVMTPSISRTDTNEENSSSVETSTATEKIDETTTPTPPSSLVPPDVGTSSTTVSSSGYISPNIISLDSPSPPATSSPPNALAALNIEDS